MSSGSPADPQPSSGPKDLWNPILVKEVRQALRGKAFRFTFLGTLAVLLLATLTSLVGHETVGLDSGAYFVAVYSCLLIAIAGVVPFGAFHAMGGEWDESTWDLLVLTDLRPRRIVLGKLYSAGVQALLFVSAFLPFLVVAFLQPGLDLRACGLLLAIALVLACLATLAAIALSTLSRQRFVRVVLQMVLAGLIAAILATMLGFATLTVRFPRGLLDPNALIALAFMVAVGLVLAAYLFALACNMLAHAEENRSSNARLVTTIGSLLLMASVGVLVRTTPTSSDFICTAAIAGIGVVSGVGVLFVTERRALGRRTRLHVPHTPLVALLTAPWYPGGGRGVVLHVLHVILIALIGVCLTVFSRPASEPFLGNGVAALLATVPFSIVFVTAFPGLCARWCETPGKRLAVRIATPVVMLLVILVPGIVGLMTGDLQLQRLEHVGNAFRILDRAFTTDSVPADIVMLLAAAVLVSMLLNAPRIVRSAMETLDAARDNRARAVRSSAASVAPRRADADAVA